MSNTIEDLNHKTEKDEYVPFPVGLLPTYIESFVLEGSKSIGCPPVSLVLPLLSCLGSAIGNGRIIVPKESGWYVPPVFWTAVVGKSGTTKTPAFRAATEFIDEIETFAYEEFIAESKDFDERMAKWKKSKEGDPPAPPVRRRFYVDDTTMEALLPILAENNHGVMVINNELNTWFGSFDRYVAGKGADAAKWINIWDGKSVSLDRKTGLTKSIRVERPIVNIAGTIQPSVLNKAVANKHIENGLLARILIAYPPSECSTWNEETISDYTTKNLRNLFYRLQEGLSPGDEGPVVLRLAYNAKSVWKTFFDSNQQRIKESEDNVAYAFAKHDQYALRIAMLLELLKCCQSGRYDQILVSEETMQESVEIIHWFQNELVRTYRLLDSQHQNEHERELVFQIAKKGGKISVRELQNSNSKKYRSSHDARAALEALEAAGIGSWISGKEFSLTRQESRCWQEEDYSDPRNSSFI